MAAEIQEFDARNLSCSELAVEAIVRLEKKIFPKHESLSKSFHEELRKKNCGLLYAKLGVNGEEEEIVGYVMYSWVSSLCASITKLAGEITEFFIFHFFYLS